MKKILFLFVILIISTLVFSCSISTNSGNSNVNHNIDNNQLITNYYKFKVVEKSEDYQDELKIISVILEQDYNDLIEFNSAYSDKINGLTNDNKSIDLLVSDILYSFLKTSDEFICQLGNNIQVTFNNNSKDLFTVDNENTFIPFADGKISYNMNGLSSRLSLFLMNSYNYYYHVFLGTLIFDNYNNVFGIIGDTFNELSFEIALLKHKRILNGEPKWKDNILGEVIDQNQSPQELVEYLSKYNLFSNEEKYYEFTLNNNYIDDKYLLLVLDSYETFSQNEVTNQYFSNGNNTFDGLIESITELDRDIYNEIKKRLNGEEVSEDILNIDLNNYHRRFILKLNEELEPYILSSLMSMNLEHVTYIGYDYFHFQQSTKQLSNFSNYIKLQFVEEVERIYSNVLVNCVKVYDYDNDISTNESINLLIPDYIYQTFTPDYEFIYQLNGLSQIQINDKQLSYYDINNNMDSFVPLLNGYFIDFVVQTNDSRFNDWINNINYGFFGKINSYIFDNSFIIEQSPYVFNEHADEAQFHYLLDFIKNEMNENECLDIIDQLLLKYILKNQ